MLFLPVAIALLAMFTLGLGLIVATANTFYRDCGHLIAVFLQAWYFATPILFPIERFGTAAVAASSESGVLLHRDVSRHLVSRGAGLGSGLVAAAAVIAAASLGIGYAIFKSQEDKMVFRL